MLRRTLTELSDSEYRYASALSWSSPVPPCRNVVKSSISVVAKQENVLNLGFELLGCLPHQMSNQAVNSVLVSAQIIREGVAPRLGTSRETFRDCPGASKIKYEVYQRHIVARIAKMLQKYQKALRSLPGSLLQFSYLFPTTNRVFSLASKCAPGKSEGL